MLTVVEGIVAEHSRANTASRINALVGISFGSARAIKTEHLHLSKERARRLAHFLAKEQIAQQGERLHTPFESSKMLL